MTASVTVTPDMNLAAIATAAGAASVDQYWYDPAAGLLYVSEITQAALDDALAAYDPDALPPEKILAEKFAAGCAVVSSTAHPVLTGIWALDQETQLQVAILATSAAQFGLPRGVSSINFPDKDGTPHTLSVADIGLLFTTLRDYIDEIEEVAATLAAGGTAGWPAQPVAIA
jgi:hypothetical protein